MATEYMGSLLSAYALTNDTNFLNSAKLVGDRLKVEFDTPTGLPNKLMKKSTLKHNTSVHLAEAGGQYLEFGYLADMTNNLDMKAKVRKARTFVHNARNCHTGLYMHSIDVMTGEWTSTSSSLFWPANTFYQYLIKSYVQSGGKDEQAIEMYREAIDAVLNNNGMIQTSGRDQPTYVGPYRIESSLYTDYDGCYLGGMLALGADAMQRKLANCSNIEEQTRIEQHWALAKEITERCHINFRKNNIAKNNFNNGNRAASGITFESIAAMAESYFVLYRFTHNPKYRDYAWELAQTIHKQCRTEEGKYYQLSDDRREYYRNTSEQAKLNFLATTLKYLYLIFSDDSVLPLDKWVFNKAGQPLPICGKNPAYPSQKCPNSKANV